MTSEKVRNYIPDDLAFSVLSKLSIKSLKRFGCAHKSWALLFENPCFMSIFRKKFISNHNSYDDNTSLLERQIVDRFQFYSPLYLLSGERFENRVKLDWPNPFQEDVPYFNVLDSGSIFGTLCLYRWPDKVIFWNLATKEFKVIPPSPVESVSHYRRNCCSLHGFGYDQVRDDYKLIRYVNFFALSSYDLELLGMEHEDVDCRDISYDPLWEIYSSKSNSWIKLDVDMPVCMDGVCERLYMDGMCCWLGINHNDEECLVSFELSNEVFFITPKPSDIPLDVDTSFKFNLVMLNGSIAWISYYTDTSTFHVSILGELGVKESWTKVFIVGPLACVENVIGAGKKGKIFFRKKCGEFSWIHLSTNMIEDLGVKGECYHYIVSYKENFLPIGEINP